MSSNLTLFQFFHWYYYPDQQLWQHVADQADKLKLLGITHVWLPPAYKSALGVDEPGYAVYDLYDLGEFDQKNNIRTRYGTKEEYLKAINVLHEHHIQVIADVVLNHKMGGDEMEQVCVTEVMQDNRNEILSKEQVMESDTRFTFPGRGKKYSEFVWDKNCFTGLSRDRNVYLINHEYTNGNWDVVIEEEKGNFDYLMGYDIEFRNPFVRQELKNWGNWYVETTQIDGFRLDALKHITPQFYPDWIDHLENKFQKDFFVMGEYWRNDVGVLLKYIAASQRKIKLFDVPLHYNFQQASLQGKNYDIRKIFDNTLTQQDPEMAITFVDNHDTQPMQGLESPVEEWFKPIAYAMILLRAQGTPCVFYPSLYEASYKEIKGENELCIKLKKVPAIETLLQIRKWLSYGDQQDYFAKPNTLGWTRAGMDKMQGSGVAVIVSNGGEGMLEMCVGQQHAGKVMIDACLNRREKIQLNEKGSAQFFVNAGSVSVWIFETNTSIQLNQV